MKRSCVSGAVACVGAVIGAGFASGREIVAFFTRYGMHAWWLILLSVGTMMALSALCMQRAAQLHAACWCDLYVRNAAWVRQAAQLCATLMMAITGGAMVSASGHMIALLWANSWAYPVGAVGTLALAWLTGHGSLKPLSWISGVLAALFLAAMLAVLAADPPRQVVRVAASPDTGALLWAAVRAVAYAAMNLTLAIGVVCGCAGRSRRGICRLAATFGLLLLPLLLVSNYLYAKHPELLGEAFPIVRLMRLFARNGFVVSVLMMYLAIFTTLVAVVYAVRGAVERRAKRPLMQLLLTVGPPLLVSCVGFEGIVDTLYAPAGMVCLAAIFGPLALRKRHPQA